MVKMNNRILIPLVALGILVLGVGFFVGDFSVNLQPASQNPETVIVSTNPKSIDGIVQVLTSDLDSALTKIDYVIEGNTNEWVYSWVIELTQNLTIGNSTVNQTFLAGSTLVCFGLDGRERGVGEGGGVICHQFTPTRGGSVSDEDLSKIIEALKKMSETMTTPDGEDIENYAKPLRSLASKKTPGGQSAGVKFEHYGLAEEWFNNNLGGAKSKLLFRTKLEGRSIDF